MKITEPSAEIMHISGDLKTIELAARTCYKSEDRISESSAEKLVGNLVNRGHHAMLEFMDVTVRFITDRGIANEIVRHRIASYAQESTRYVNYKKREIEFIEPLCIKNGDIVNRTRFAAICAQSEKDYISFLESGLTPQDARGALPLWLKTELVMKANLRSWYNFFLLRTAPAAHPEMRRIAIPLLREFQKRIAIVFDDIQPSC